MMQFDELWDYGQPEETRQRFLPLVDSHHAVADTDYKAQLLTQIARTHSLQGHFAAAHKILDDVEALLTEEMLVAKTRYLLERGRTHNSAGEKQQAEALFLQALETAEAAAVQNPTADYHVIDTIHMLGIVGAPEKQIEWSLKGIARAEQTTDPKARHWLGALYNNLGWSYHDSGAYEEALATFKKGVAFRHTQKEVAPLRIAKWCVGRALRSLARYQEAYQVQVGLLDEYSQGGSRSGYVFEEIAECCLDLGLPYTGRAYAHLAYQELAQDSWLVEHETERLERLKRWAMNE